MYFWEIPIWYHVGSVSCRFLCPFLSLSLSLPSSSLSTIPAEVSVQHAHARDSTIVSPHVVPLQRRLRRADVIKITCEVSLGISVPRVLGHLVSLSVQQFVDCDTKDCVCNGVWMYSAPSRLPREKRHLHRGEQVRAPSRNSVLCCKAKHQSSQQPRKQLNMHRKRFLLWRLTRRIHVARRVPQFLSTGAVSSH